MPDTALIKIDKGLNLDWRIGLSSALIVLCVLSVMMAWQDHRDISESRADRHLLIKEALAPVQAELITRDSIEQVEKTLKQFRDVYNQYGYRDYHLELTDREGNLIATTRFVRDNTADPARKEVNTELSIPGIQKDKAILSVYQDTTKFNFQTRYRWRFWILDLATTGVCILLSTQLLIRHYVTIPLSKLTKSIHKMEMGYWDPIKIRGGAREIQWVAHRFNSLMAELEDVIRRLVDAERHSITSFSHYETSESRTEKVSDEEVKNDDVTGEQKESETDIKEPMHPVEQYLWDKCRLLESLNPTSARAKQLALEVWEQDVAYSGRLEAHHLRSHLEEIAFRILNPDDYRLLTEKIALRLAVLKSRSVQAQKKISVALKKYGVAFTSIQYRVKNTAAVWRKMQSKGVELDQISDLVAFRIIVESEEECYAALKIVHSLFQPRLFRFKDYIAQPKPNGYRSIHTSVSVFGDFDLEIQIRTQQMHKHAEQGQAAHWRYKQMHDVRLSGNKR